MELDANAVAIAGIIATLLAGTLGALLGPWLADRRREAMERRFRRFARVEELSSAVTELYFESADTLTDAMLGRGERALQNARLHLPPNLAQRGRAMLNHYRALVETAEGGEIWGNSLEHVQDSYEPFLADLRSFVGVPAG